MRENSNRFFFVVDNYGIFVQAAPERLRDLEAKLRQHGAVEVRGES